MSCPQVLHITDPFKRQSSTIQTGVEVDSTIWDYVYSRFPEKKEFPVPTLCYLNGQGLSRKVWSRPLKEGDVVVFVPHVGDVVTIIYYAVVLIISIAVTLAIQDPVLPGETTQKGDPAYNLSGMQNRIRLGEPIESHYGRCRIWPSYATRPYNQYVGNEQIQYSLFCIGQGTYSIDTDEIYFEDTPISELDDVTVEIVPPGGSITLFPDNVTTVPEVSNLQLFGTNEASYPDPDGWEGGYVINDAGTVITSVEIDIVAPNGLFALYEGLTLAQQANFEFQVLEIDDEGAAVGSWTTVITDNVRAATRTAQRRTFSATVTEGRYMGRARRTNTVSTSSSAQSDIYWEALRGFKASTKNYGEVTMVAVRATATNNLNNNTRSRFNLFATRMLRTWNIGTQSWSALTATRNPSWAAVDILSAAYGGQLEDEFFALDEFALRATEFNNAGAKFDFTFDQPITAWEGATTALRSSRARPLLEGSTIVPIRDGLRTVVEGVFTRSNIVANSLEWSLSLATHKDYDGLIVEYTDPSTFLPTEVECNWPGDLGERPERITLPGCTQRQQAYEEGMVLRGMRLLNKENVSFQTGLEGHVPSYNALVAVTHDVMRRGVSGLLLSIEADKKTLNLSEPVEIVAGYNHSIILRQADGSGAGPYGVDSLGVDNRQVVLTEALSDTVIAEFTFDGTAQMPYYTFGVTSLETFYGKVVSLEPNDDDTVGVTVVEYRPEIYRYDGTTPPAEVTPTLPPSDTGDVSNITITNVPDRPEFVSVSWNPAQGAIWYIIEVSYETDGVYTAWDRVAMVSGFVTSYDVPVTAGNIKVRIAVFRRFRSGFVTSSVKEVGIAGSAPGVVTVDTPPAFDGLTASITWQPNALASTYTVAVHKTGVGTALRTVDNITSPLSFDYTSADMATDDAVPSRSLDVKVKAVNSAGASEFVTTTLVNPAPAALTGLAAVDAGGGDYDLSWDATPGPPTDFLEYRVYTSTSPGVVPGAGTLAYAGTTPAVTLAVGVTTYWKVAAFDVWANDHTDAVFAAEQEITI